MILAVYHLLQHTINIANVSEAIAGRQYVQTMFLVWQSNSAVKRLATPYPTDTTVCSDVQLGKQLRHIRRFDVVQLTKRCRSCRDS